MELLVVEINPDVEGFMYNLIHMLHKNLARFRLHRPHRPPRHLGIENSVDVYTNVCMHYRIIIRDKLFVVNPELPGGPGGPVQQPMSSAFRYHMTFATSLS